MPESRLYTFFVKKRIWPGTEGTPRLIAKQIEEIGEKRHAQQSDYALLH